MEEWDECSDRHWRCVWTAKPPTVPFSDAIEQKLAGRKMHLTHPRFCLGYAAQASRLSDKESGQREIECWHLEIRNWAPRCSFPQELRIQKAHKEARKQFEKTFFVFPVFLAPRLHSRNVSLVYTKIKSKRKGRREEVEPYQ